MSSVPRKSKVIQKYRLRSVLTPGTSFFLTQKLKLQQVEQRGRAKTGQLELGAAQQGFLAAGIFPEVAVRACRLETKEAERSTMIQSVDMVG